jgi:hypothetical protein
VQRDSSTHWRRPVTPSWNQAFGLILMVGLVGLVGFGVERLARRGVEAEAQEDVHPTPSVIVAVRDLARLESTEMHVEKVIDLTDRQERLFGLVQVQDAILLVAAADVTAGVDLSEIRDEDVVVDHERHRVTITLPQPRVFSARLDNENTYVHTRQTDTLARRREDLETRARQEAERAMEAAALDAGLLARAKTNASRTVEALVRSLGFEHVTVTWQRD